MEKVRHELVEMQNLLENVKKEMSEIKKQRHQSPDTRPQSVNQSTGSRPPSVNSNKTFIYENAEKENAGGDTENDKESSKSGVAGVDATKTTAVKDQGSFQQQNQNEENSGNNADDDDNSVVVNIEFKTDLEDIQEDEQTVIDEGDNASAGFDTRGRASAGGLHHDNMVEEASTISTSPELKGSEEEEYMYAPKPAINMKAKNRPPVLKRNSRVIPTKNNILPNHPINPMSAGQQNYPEESKRFVAKSNELFPSALRRYERPKDAMLTCLSSLDSSNWEQVMNGLQTFVRLIRHHPEYVDSQIHLMTIALSKHVKNLRSQVARAACTVSLEFFETHAKSLDQDGEELTASLLGRSADTNKFLRSDATKALEGMCEMLLPSKVIAILTFRGAIHQNAAVRCTTAKLLNQLVHRVGCERVFNMKEDIRDKLIVTCANLLTEGSLETRNYTKDIFRQLSIHPAYPKLLLEVIPANVYRNIQKTLKSI